SVGPRCLRCEHLRHDRACDGGGRWAVRVAQSILLHCDVEGSAAELEHADTPRGLKPDGVSVRHGNHCCIIAVRRWQVCGEGHKWWKNCLTSSMSAVRRAGGSAAST